MNKSFIERIFPHSPSSVLPRYEDDTPSQASTSRSPPRIRLRESPDSASGSPASQHALQAAPMSASIVHQFDPFLPVDRAAKALQRTIQSLLDAQSDGLNTSLTGVGTEDISSVGSPTPTPSLATPSRSNSMPKTIPVRQPAPKKTSLRGARRGLNKAMEEFAQLKEEELNIITSEASSRENALKKSRRFQQKKDSLIEQMEAIQGEESATNAASLRAEADKVKVEIQHLESRLFELRARYRQLITQADQFSNSLESKLSSYRSSLALVEKDVKQFLRHPPVSNSLPLFDDISSDHGGMHSLKAERRTLEMAQDQWVAEEELLSNRKADVESEREALREGASIWRDATRRISEFEKSLREVLKDPPAQANGLEESTNSEDRHAALLLQLDRLIASLQDDLGTAESNSWNLLICCLGAELEALEQGRVLLGGAPEPSLQKNANGTKPEGQPNDPDEEASNHPDDLLNGAILNSPGAGSNQSLEDTLKAFGDGTESKGKQPVRLDQSSSPIFETPPARSKTLDSRDESEDDDPGPDFLLSH